MESNPASCRPHPSSNLQVEAVIVEMEIGEAVSVADCKPCKLSAIISIPHPPPDDAFLAKHMPDPGHGIREFQVFHWKLQGWRKLGRSLTSSEFECGGYKW